MAGAIFYLSLLTKNVSEFEFVPFLCGPRYKSNVGNVQLIAGMTIATMRV